MLWGATIWRWLLLLLLLLHHVGRVLEHLVGQVERPLLVNIVGRGTLADIDIPKTEHLVSLNLNLSFTVASRDCCAIRRNTTICCCVRGEHIIGWGNSHHGTFIFHLSTIKVLSVSRRFALADRFGYFVESSYCINIVLI